MITGTCTTPSAIARSDSKSRARHADREEADADKQGLHERNADDAIGDRFHGGRDDVHIMLAALPSPVMRAKILAIYARNGTE